MASYTKGMRKQQAEIQEKIAEAHRMGLCDSDGNSVKDSQGCMVAKPRSIGVVKLHKVYPDAFKGK